MVPMPYILVTIVSNIISLVYFSLTSAALLAKYSPTNRFFPSLLQRHRTMLFLAYSLLLLGLLYFGVYVKEPLNHVHIGPVFFFDIIFCIAFANSLVLVYQFLSQRWFRHLPNIRRRILIALCSLVIVTVPVLAVTAAVVKIFTIR